MAISLLVLVGGVVAGIGAVAVVIAVVKTAKSRNDAE